MDHCPGGRCEFDGLAGSSCTISYHYSAWKPHRVFASFRAQNIARREWNYVLFRDLPAWSIALRYFIIANITYLLTNHMRCLVSIVPLNREPEQLLGSEAVSRTVSLLSFASPWNASGSLRFWVTGISPHASCEEAFLLDHPGCPGDS